MIYLESSADITADGVYRYALTRGWSTGLRTVAFIGLNPSTADALKDDATIRREVGFARAWGFDRLVKGNLYAYRATHPADLWAAAERLDIVGPANIVSLFRITAQADIVVVAWGAARLTPPAIPVAAWLRRLRHARCLGYTKQGGPKHPLRLASNTRLITVINDEAP